MVGSGVAVVLSAFLLLPYGSMAATLNSETGSVVRRESETHAIHLTANGEMIKQRRSSSSADDCNLDFPLGKPGTNDCNEDGTDGTSKHQLIEEEALCVQAAIEAGATTTHDNFVIDARWEDKSPIGCFRQSCSESKTNGVCYFFNSKGGDMPANIDADKVVVCKRPRMKISPPLDQPMPTTGTAPVCPPNYKRVKGVESDPASEEEVICQSAGRCLGQADSSSFLIGRNPTNTSRHADYPRGCIMRDDNKTYFNPDNTDVGYGKDNGRLICRVKECGEDAAECAGADYITPACEAKRAACLNCAGTITDATCDLAMTVRYGKVFSASEKADIVANHSSVGRNVTLFY